MNGYKIAYEKAIRAYTKSDKIPLAEQLQSELDAIRTSGHVAIEPPTPIFNGVDLTGWERSRGDPSIWTIAEKQLVATGGRGYLVFADRGTR